MTQFDKEYYIVARDYRTKNSAPRFIGYGPKNEIAHLFTGNPAKRYAHIPLLFESDEIEERLEDNLPGEVGDINVSGGWFLVKQWVRDLFYTKPNYGLQIVSAIFEDIYGNYHEPLWYLHFYNTLECWHRERSVRAFPELEYDEGDAVDIDVFSLDENILALMPLKERLVFEILETASPPITIFHESLVEEFEKRKASGALWFRVDQYYAGLEIELRMKNP